MFFQPIAFEIQGAAGPSTEIFLKEFCNNLCTCSETCVVSFISQKVSLATHVADAACVRGTINDKITFEGIFYL